MKLICRRGPLLALALLLGLCSPTAATETPPQLRDASAPPPLTPVFSYIHDSSSIVRGAGDESSYHRGLLEIGAELDLDRLVGMPGGRVVIRLQGLQGGEAATPSSALQTTSNIDADEFQRLGELWIEQTLGSGRFRVKVGNVDANTEFAATESGAEFLNSSMGPPPTITDLPTYPIAATSVNVFARLGAGFQFGAGVYDGGASWHRARIGLSRPFLIGEMGWQRTPSTRRSGGRFALGYWRSSTDSGFDLERDSILREGWYLASDVALPLAEQLSVCAMLSGAQGSGQEVPQHWYLGLRSAAPWAARHDDSFGLAISQAKIDTGSAHGGSRGRETVIELYYRLATLSSIYIQPDIQWIMDPSGDPTVDDALALTLRIDAAY